MFKMARPRRTISHSNRASSPCEQDLSALSSEVLKLRLQAPLDRASLSSIDEMIESDPEPDESNFQQNIGFSQTLRAAIEAIVTDSVRSAVTTLQTSPAAHLPSPAAHLPSASPQNLFRPGMASPLGLSRPVDKTLEDKILWGEYVDFALLLPDTLYQSQTPEIQLRLDDSSSGPMGWSERKTSN